MVGFPFMVTQVLWGKIVIAKSTLYTEGQLCKMLVASVFDCNYIS